MSVINRRTAFKHILAGSAAVVSTTILSSFNSPEKDKTVRLKGNVNHSVCRWTYNKLSVEELCKTTKDIGFAAIDLVGPKDWPTLQQYGVFSSMCNGAEINLTDGWNNLNFHSTLIENYKEMIPMVAKNGYNNLICFSGNRHGMDEESGLANCIAGLKQIIGLAEKNKVVLHMELLNSKIDHKDYMCDKSEWGIELCKRIGSPNFKLLYDIYHMQIDEGDVIRTINNYHSYFGHYHTGGVPGRHEIDETQELNYQAIIKAIVATGFKGYIAQEFIPAEEDKINSLRKAIVLCDI
jgi:hydroxypyruvate isomerase